MAQNNTDGNIAQTQAQSQAQAPSIQNQNEVSTQNQTQVQAQAQQSQSQNVDVKINANLKELNNMNKIQAQTQNADNTKIQTQTQQIIANLQNNTTQASSQQQEATAQITTPVIQVANDINTIMGKNVGQDDMPKLFEKAGLTQELIDNTNAKITSVSTNAQTMSNFTGQDASEQGMKLAIEQASSAIQNQTSGTQGSATEQTAFDKTLAQTTTKSQTISNSELLSQINNKLSTSQETGTSRITMILKPESLGRLHIELKNGQNGLTANITAENASVKEALDKNLDNLKNTLSSQGLNVTNVSVKVDESQKQSPSDFQQEQQNYKDGENKSNSNQQKGQGEFSEKGEEKQEANEDSQHSPKKDKREEKELAFSK